ncbi:MAG TPA: hypothetical protein VEP89_11620 [Draconibacterium sp.]|nr:hypothetical protein [Draconibacterium sp.]
MMKQLIILISVLVFSGMYSNCRAGINSANSSQKNAPGKGEQLFLEHADDCLTLMAKKAEEESIAGVALIAFIPGDKTESWISKMKVAGMLADGRANYLAIASAKAAEMAVTLEDSGDSERRSIDGELGYKGGAIAKVNSGYLVAAFSGGTGQQDYDLSKLALEWFTEFYK